MKQWSGWVLLLAAMAGGCVSKQDASSVAVRMFNAVPDGSQMALSINGVRKTGGYDYAAGTPYIVASPGPVAVKIEESLATNASPGIRTLDERTVNLAANDELTLIVMGQEASDAVEVLAIASTTRGVPTGRMRIQLVHGAFGQPSVDVYILPPGTLPAASTPLAANLAYRDHTDQTEIAGGNGEIIITAAGDPGTVLLDSGPMFLPLESTWTLVVVANPGIDAADRPVRLVMLSGTASTEIPHLGTRAQTRFVNVSPGSYAIDGFINAASVDPAARQDCDPATVEADTPVEECARPFGFVGVFHAINAGSYAIKMQKTGEAGVSARSVGQTLVAGSEGTLVISGLVADTETTMTTGLQALAGTRRMAQSAQLRIGIFSQAAVATLAGNPTTDRLELHVMAACAAPGDRSPEFFNLIYGSDTGYRSFTPGDYQVMLARRDTATPPAFPLEILLSKRMTLAPGGIFTELVTDSVGGVLPPVFLAVDDDPHPQDCPPP